MITNRLSKSETEPFDYLLNRDVKKLLQIILILSNFFFISLSFYK